MYGEDHAHSTALNASGDLGMRMRRNGVRANTVECTEILVPILLLRRLTRVMHSQYG